MAFSLESRQTCLLIYASFYQIQVRYIGVNLICKILFQSVVLGYHFLHLTPLQGIDILAITPHMLCRHLLHALVIEGLIHI